MKKETQVDGLRKTTFVGDDAEKQITIGEEQNIDSHLKHNKELYNSNDGYSPSRELKRVASIPILALQIWAKEYNGNNNCRYDKYYHICDCYTNSLFFYVWPEIGNDNIMKFR